MFNEIEHFIRRVSDPLNIPARQEFEDQNRTTEVWCKRTECLHNRAGKCYARTIMINGLTECAHYETEKGQ